MADVFEELTSLDKVVHEPARLALLTALSACHRADFTYLRRLTGLTQGNLSSHLDKLQAAGLVRVEKRFVGRKPNTMVTLSTAGREAVERHWRRLDELRQKAADWDPAQAASPSTSD